MDFEQLSIFRNLLEIQAFARGYILAMPDKDKYLDEHDEWCGFSEDIDVNFYCVDGVVNATAYKVVDSMIDTSQEELVYTYELPKKHLTKKEAY
jgi:hypothetical protein